MVLANDGVTGVAVGAKELHEDGETVETMVAVNDGHRPHCRESEDTDLMSVPLLIPRANGVVIAMVAPGKVTHVVFEGSVDNDGLLRESVMMTLNVTVSVAEGNAAATLNGTHMVNKYYPTHAINSAVPCGHIGNRDDATTNGNSKHIPVRSSGSGGSTVDPIPKNGKFDGREIPVLSHPVVGVVVSNTCTIGVNLNDEHYKHVGAHVNGVITADSSPDGNIMGGGCTHFGHASHVSDGVSAVRRLAINNYVIYIVPTHELLLAHTLGSKITACDLTTVNNLHNTSKISVLGSTPIMGACTDLRHSTNLVTADNHHLVVMLPLTGGACVKGGKATNRTTKNNDCMSKDNEANRAGMKSRPINRHMIDDGNVPDLLATKFAGEVDHAHEDGETMTFPGLLSPNSGVDPEVSGPGNIPPDTNHVKCTLGLVTDTGFIEH